MDQIDDALMLVVGERWRKVAMVVVTAAEKLGWRVSSGGGWAFDSDERDESLNRIAGRLAVLVADGRLEAQGDLTRWRNSEVRRPS
ncbi:hypothetical protein ACO2Q3_08480 [Caulobacter sp. KR2-114]|uniref:hypothetical protein n=1 Tax=Caulobacter sp. KR2-114 TaxID=3400912 RepID=UPI003C0E16C4